MSRKLGRALQFRRPIFNYVVKDSDLREHELTSDEWKALEMVTGWLKAFRSATTQMSATKQPMPTLFSVASNSTSKPSSKSFPDNADPALKEGLVNAHRKLSDYFTKFDESRYCTWAARSFVSIQQQLRLLTRFRSFRPKNLVRNLA
ncbi:hypothetical protein DFH09DRAFT_943418 [Mycena vulgaris]|nr:hypothetical protein DFH09DRAFT_943418 [Mycena vulgaris]